MRSMILAAALAMTAQMGQAQEAMTEAEKMDFWEQVAECYLPPEGTFNTSITVRFELDREGMIVNDLIETVRPTGDTDSQVRNMYEAVRAALIRCGRRGYDLPEGKYVYWQDIVMTFNAPVRTLDQMGDAYE